MSKRKMVNQNSNSSSESECDGDNLQVALIKKPSLAVSEMTISPDDNALCIFKPVPIKLTASDKSWIEEFEYNMGMGNSTVVYCDSVNNNLANDMMCVKNKLNLYKFMHHLYPNIDSHVSVVTADPPRVVNQIGWHVHGGIMQYYFFDQITMKLFVGKHGPFIKASWKHMPFHNEVISNCIKVHKELDGNMLLQDEIFINVPAPSEETKRRSFINKFYDITRQRNETVYANGIKNSCQQLVCDMFDADRFEQVFALSEDDKKQVKPSDSVTMYMYATLEGYKMGREQIFHTLTDAKVKNQTYSIAIQPICFFNVEP
ncbi:Dbp-2 [Ectropis obliqua nucleopolyhedrovirus]|uniref:Dbp-2 n=1 Tax=Ectropis obliqua nucleopolyhedrovirus TaxID=59376 RepID=A0EYT0_9ABAC|nr:Dbp-2 [Ectropis obliqua nucleopolyhedrovirus]ABI35711.1 Dbp-2 [Ectropis obliqua nucleopolyhedrovirus]AGS47888.1 putative 36.6 kDa protein [Ectropis obliqua nucleopolyhedrovirus]QWV59613.1 Dbp-2 [Ectropis obliqua nucleopolyhedrovirus]UYO72819.1 Dbp-2 [Ectropis obliqua nucleopolyhedrovirus]